MAMVVRGDRAMVPYNKPPRNNKSKVSKQLSTEQRIDRALVAASNAFSLSKSIYGYLNGFRTVKKSGGVTQGVAPAAFNAAISSISPVVTRGGTAEGLITVTHREYVGTYDVRSGGISATYVVNQPINPMNFTIFPWLSGIASSYEKYKFSKLAVCVVPTCPTSSVGKCVVAIDPDSTDSQPSSYNELQNMRYSTGAAVWEPQVLKYNPCGEYRFCSATNGSTAAFTVDRLINDGWLYISNSGPALTNANDVYIEYTVQLKQPQTNPGTGQVFNITSGSVAATFLSNANSMGPAYATSGTGASRTLNFQNTGQYFVTLYVTGTTLAVVGTTPGTDVNLSEVSFTAAGGTGFIWIFKVTVNGLNTPTVVITFTAATITGDFLCINRIDQAGYNVLF